MESKKFEKVLSYLKVTPVYSLSLQIDFFTNFWGIMRMTESISYEQKTRTHSKNGLEFLSTNDASSILRNWIFCPEITYRSYQSQISFENFRAFFLAGSVAVKVVPAIILNFLQFGSKLGFRLTRLR